MISINQIYKAPEKYHATEELAGYTTSSNNITRMGTMLWFLSRMCICFQYLPLPCAVEQKKSCCDPYCAHIA